VGSVNERTHLRSTHQSGKCSTESLLWQIKMHRLYGSVQLYSILLEGNFQVPFFQTIFDIASGYSEEEDARKVALLLHFIGEGALEIFDFFNFDVDTVTFDALVKKFEKNLVPKSNVTMENRPMNLLLTSPIKAVLVNLVRSLIGL